MKFQAFCSSLLAAINISQQVNAIQIGLNADVESQYNAFNDETNLLAQVAQVGGIYDAVTTNPYSRPCAGQAGKLGAVGAPGPRGK